MRKRSNENKIKLSFYIIFILLLFLTTFIYFTNYSKHGKNNNNNVPVNNTVLNTSSNNSKDELYGLISSDVDLNYYREYYKNDEIVARLEIPELFNIFVTKASDNEYYLNRSINKKKDVRGNEFMDYRVNPLSKQVNIYGHNSRTYDTPFRKLENYLDEEFYHNNPYIILQHDDGHRIYKIFAIKEVLTDYEHMNVDKNEEEFVSHIDDLKQDAIYQTDVKYNKDSNIIILQTCSYDSKDAYYIIMAIEI